MRTADPIRLVLSDVDGTLINSRRELTPATIDAVGRLRDADVMFAVTSGRPPRGLSMLAGPLELDTPLAAFNGGEFVTPEMEELRTLDVPGQLVEPIISAMRSHGLFAWIYSGSEWYVTDPKGSHAAREATTVEFQPTIVDTLVGIGPVAKIVGASDDHEAVARAAEATRAEFGHAVSAARSQPYYLDITHPHANKGAVVTYLASEFDIPLESVATLGDMPNDVLMFAHCGVSIAMGNASLEVQRSARHVTDTNDEDGFARAIDRFVLGGS